MQSGIARSLKALERMREALHERTEFDETLANEYHRLRRSLGAAFQELSLDSLGQAAVTLEDVRLEVAATMTGLFSGRVHSELLQVRGYHSPHSEIFDMLALHIGEEVPAWRLRMLTNEAVHTERRTRELRDLGLSIMTTVRRDAMTGYQLMSFEIDALFGAAYLLRENAINAGSRYTLTERLHLISLAEKTAHLPERKKPTK